MIGAKIQAMLLEHEEQFLIPESDVAHVQTENNLNHALLVLTKIGYNVIVVLDRESKVRGLVSIPMIMDAITGIHNIHFERLDTLTVTEVMATDFAVAKENWELEDILHLLVDNNFICIVDDEQKFKGIITRREVLKAVNHLAHEFEREYDVNRREETAIN